MPTSTAEPGRLISRVPFLMRYKVLGSGEYQRLCSDFVQSHVNECVSALITRLSETRGFEDELDELRSQEDYISAAREDDVCLMEDNGTWFHFNWKDPTTIPVDNTGHCVIQFDRFAADKGLRLGDWRWNASAEEAVHISAVDDENREDLVEGPVLAHIAAVPHNDAGEMISFLAQAAAQIGTQAHTELAEELRKPQKYAQLFENYLDADAALSLEEFDDEESAARDACNSYGIDPQIREIYEHWTVDSDMAHWLREQGEVVVDNFADCLTVWGRTTTGQSISMDAVIGQIVNERYADKVDALLTAMYPHLGSTDENLIGVPIDILKALEDERLKVVTVEYKSRYGENAKDTHYLVLDPVTPDKAWVLDSGYLAQGVKSDITPETSQYLFVISKNFTSGRELIGRGLSTANPSEELDNELAASLAHFHNQNKGSSMHVMPERLEERLAAISPEYARKLADRTSAGPSLG